MTRYGPRMRDVAAYVIENPGCLMIDAARFVGPHGSLKFGYRTVHRAIDAGIVEKRPGPRKGTFTLHPIEEQPRIVRVASDVRYYPEDQRRAVYLAWCQREDCVDTLAARISADVALDDHEIGALVYMFGSGCREQRKDAIRAFAHNVPNVCTYGLYERVSFRHHLLILDGTKPIGGSPEWERARTTVRCEYTAGQSYPDEVKRVRSLMTGY